MRTLIIGANSAVARALAEALAKQKQADLVLASRDVVSLTQLAQVIEARYPVKVTVKALDVTDFSSHQPFMDALSSMPDCVIYAAGVLFDQSALPKDFLQVKQTIEVNYSGAVSLLGLLSNKMVDQRIAGTIVGMSSVAGIRGRPSNYIYGSAKAGFTTYLSGLRATLRPHHIHVVTVIPGYIQTKMTANMALPKRLTATPQEAADAIVNAMSRKKNTLYIKPIWRYIAMVIALLPECCFKRINW